MKLVAKELKKEGKTQREIAAKLGVGKVTVHDWIVSNKFGSEKATNVRVPRAEHTAIVEGVGAHRITLLILTETVPLHFFTAVFGLGWRFRHRKTRF